MDPEVPWRINDNKVLDAASVSVPVWDLVFVVVNDSEYGGAGGTPMSRFSMQSLAAELALHETGHTFGLLGDEYDGSTEPYNGPEPLVANATIETDRNKIKWNHWIEDSYPYSNHNRKRWRAWTL